MHSSIVLKYPSVNFSDIFDSASNSACFSDVVLLDLPIFLALHTFVWITDFPFNTPDSWYKLPESAQIFKNLILPFVSFLYKN